MVPSGRMVRAQFLKDPEKSLQGLRSVGEGMNEWMKKLQWLPFK